MHEGDEEAGLLIGKIYWVPSERTEADYWPCMVVEERCKFLLPERHRPARKSTEFREIKWVETLVGKERWSYS